MFSISKTVYTTCLIIIEKRQGEFYDGGGGGGGGGSVGDGNGNGDYLFGFRVSIKECPNFNGAL